jgi:hypothetical protein
LLTACESPWLSAVTPQYYFFKNNVNLNQFTLLLPLKIYFCSLGQ